MRWWNLAALEADRNRRSAIRSVITQTIDFPLMADVAGNDWSVAALAQRFAVNPEHLDRTESPRRRLGRVYKGQNQVHAGPRFAGARGIGLVAEMTENRVCRS